MKERDIHTKLVSLPGTRQKVKKTEIQGNHKKKIHFMAKWQFIELSIN